MEKRGIFLTLLLVLLVGILFGVAFLYPQNGIEGYVFKSFFSVPFSVVTNVGRVFLGVSFDVYLPSPLNTSYSFSPGTYYGLSMKTYSNRNVSNWRYTLKDLRHNVVINESVLFTPNVTIYAVRYSNKLTVEAEDYHGNRVNNSVIFFINVSNSNPIINNFSTDLYACEGTSFSNSFNITDVDEDTLDGHMTPSEPFYLGYSGNFNATTYTYEIFSGTLDKGDVGGRQNGSKKYSESVIINDGLSSDSKLLNITVIEINHAPSIENIGSYTVYTSGLNATFLKQWIVSDSEDGNQNNRNLSLNISFTGMKLFNISVNGTMNFTGRNATVGLHNVSVCVTDKGLRRPHANLFSECNASSENLSRCDNFTVLVTDTNRAPEILNHSPENLTLTVYEWKLLKFNITSYDPDSTLPNSYWYMDNLSVLYTPENTSSYLNYTFNLTSAGNHTIRVDVTDGLLNDSLTWNLTVLDSIDVCGDRVCNGAETCTSCSADCGPCEVPPGGGGGGGGGGGPTCEEKWGCSNWSNCYNLDKNFYKPRDNSENNGQNNYNGNNKTLKELYQKLFYSCANVSWGKDECGYQYRNCVDTKNCSSNFSRPPLFGVCYYTSDAGCSDRIKNCHHNSCEILIDCGGPCNACPTCSDGIKNQNEVDIDCGGSCPACPMEIPFKKGFFDLLMALFRAKWLLILIISSFMCFIIVVLLGRRYYIMKRNMRILQLKALRRL